MTIETKFDKEDIVYILIGFEIKKAIIDGVHFCHDNLQEKRIRYNVSYDTGANTKSFGIDEDKVFSTPGELLEALNRTIPLS